MSSSPAIKKRKNILQTTEPISQAVEDSSHLRSKQIDKICKGIRKVFTNVTNLREENFVKIVKNSYLNPI